MIMDLISPLITQLIPEDGGELPPPPPPPELPPQGTITFETPTKTQTTISQPYVYSGTDFTGFKARINGGSQIEEFSPVDLTGLTHSTAYQIEVAAYNVVGLGTWFSTYVTTDSPPPPDPTPPNGTVTVTAADPGETSVDVTFTYDVGSQGVDYLNFEYQLDSGSWVSARATPGTFTISGLVADTSYTVKVRATNADGPGIASAGFSFVTDAEAPPPSSVWQYTFDGVDDVLTSGVTTNKVLSQSFAGIYTFKFKLLTNPALYRGIIGQGINTTTSTGIELYLSRQSVQNYNITLFGVAYNNQPMPAGSFTAGNYVLTYNMSTGQFTMTKNGTVLADRIHAKGTLNLASAAFTCGGRKTASSYDGFNNCKITDLEVWADDTLLVGCAISTKDSIDQVTTGSLGLTMQLLNQNSPNWSEVPL